MLNKNSSILTQFPGLLFSGAKNRKMLWENAATEELVIASLLGNLNAFDTLVGRYRGAILLVSRQYSSSSELAEDIAQEVFLTAYKALPQLSEPGKFSSWLYSIARHRAIRVSKATQRLQPTELSVLDSMIFQFSPETLEEPEDACIRKLENELLWMSVQRLPEEFRLPIQLFYQEDWSVAEIGEFLALAPTTVKWRLYEGRRKLKRMLESKQAPCE